MEDSWWEAKGSKSKPRALPCPGAHAPAEGPSLAFSLHRPQEAAQAVEAHQAGDPCPNCGFARLEYDEDFSLHCPTRGFRTGAHPACTGSPDSPGAAPP
ncbi:MAG: hypothetical protein J7452_09745 [Thermoflexus sp.]|jgi:hypothetical protein|nr:hypothetical protein [Thermoflexus sp.]